jgi:putative oxidoreductase
MLGLFARPTALVVALELLLAYVFIAAPRSPWPIRNGGGEALLQIVILVCIAAYGAGAFSVDAAIAAPRAGEPLHEDG